METHRGQDGDEITLGPLVVERSIDRDLSLVRQVDTKIAVSVGGGDSVASDAFVAADPATVAWCDRIFNDAVDAGVGVERVDILEDRRTDRSELREKKTNERIIFNIIHKYIIHPPLLPRGEKRTWPG